MLPQIVNARLTHFFRGGVGCIQLLLLLLLELEVHVLLESGLLRLVLRLLRRRCWVARDRLGCLCGVRLVLSGLVVVLADDHDAVGAVLVD